MALLDRIADARRGGGEDTLSLPERESSIDFWIENYLMPSHGVFGYNGVGYTYGMGQTWPVQGPAREIAATLPAYSRALKACPPAFAAELVRSLVLSQARFVFRNLPSDPNTPRRTFGRRTLAVLEKPWANGTTGELLARMEWQAGLTGNAFVARQPDRLRVLRSDWVAIAYGSQREPDDPMGAIDAEVIGFVYRNGGFNGPTKNKPETLLPAEVAHWSPLPDPESPELGMSWVTPALRDIQGDQAATEHKLTFFRNGATPNLVVKGLQAANKKEFEEIVDRLEQRHSGLANAYRTLYLSAGADATVVGSDLRQLDFKMTQGAGETRIALLSRVPAPLLQISEGLAGSSLNAGNFGMARRIFADSWVYPTLQDLARCLAKLVEVPADAELWFDPGDMPLLREDALDAANIESVKATTIGNLVKEGFTPESSIAAVMGQNMNLLKHSGLLSVQLQPPGSMFPTPGQPPPAPTPPALPGQQPPATAPKNGQQPPKQPAGAAPAKPPG